MFYDTVGKSDRENIQANRASSRSAAYGGAIYASSAAAARAAKGITTEEELIIDDYGWLMSDENLRVGSLGESFAKFWGPGGGGSNICNVFTASALPGLRNIFGDSKGETSLEDYGINYGRVSGLSRYVVLGGGRTLEGGGGGGASTTPVPFLIGEYWSTYRYQAQSINLPPVSYLKAIRPPKMGNAFFGNVDRRATIRIMDKEGLCWYATTNFVLQNVNKRSSENMSLMQTSEGTIPLFGEPQLRVFTISGVLLNAEDYDWAREWKMNWDSYFAASTLLDNNARFYLLYGGWLLGGYLMEYTIAESAKSPFMDIIQCQVMVTDYEPLPDMTELEYEKGGVLVDQWASKESFISGQNIRSAGTIIAHDIGQPDLTDAVNGSETTPS